MDLPPKFQVTITLILHREVGTHFTPTVVITKAFEVAHSWAAQQAALAWVETVALPGLQIAPAAVEEFKVGVVRL